jgi:hypothetical protein
MDKGNITVVFLLKFYSIIYSNSVLDSTSVN